MLSCYQRLSAAPNNLPPRGMAAFDLRSEGLPRYEGEARPSKLDSYKNYIDESVKNAAPDWIPANSAAA